MASLPIVKGPMSGSGPLKVERKRAATFNPELKLPSPGSSIHDYTPERIQHSLNFANARMSRKPSPNSHKILQLYKAACMEALDEYENTEEVSKDRLHEIREYEITMSNKAWMAEVPNSAQEELQRNLLQLRRYTFAARYGDYTAQLCRQLRNQAMTSTVNNWQMISGKYNWTTISANIRKEELEWASSGSRYPEEVKSTLAVYDACGKVGIEHANMIQIIHFYATRNDLFHLGLTKELEAKHYDVIGKWIHQDLLDLPSLVPEEWIEHELPMKAALETLRDMWYETSSAIADPDTPGSWVPKLALATYCDSLKKDKAKAEKELAEAVAKRAAALLAKGDEEAALLAQATLPADKTIVPDRGPVAGKRKASDPIDTSDRKKTFRTIMQLQGKAYDERRTSINVVRELNRVVSAYRDAYGSEPPSSDDASSSKS